MSRIGLAAMKGTRHLDLDRVELSHTGPVGDRVLCLVDVARGQVLRSVSHPSLASVTAVLDGENVLVELPDGRVVDDVSRDSGEEVKADYWGRVARLRLQDGPHGAALAAYLGRDPKDVRLARAEPGEVVYSGAVTLIGSAGLRRLGVEGQDARFRSTFTVEGDLEEIPSGARLRVGGAMLEVLGEVPRCAVVDTDPRTGRRDRGVLSALPRRAGELWFGLQARVVSPAVVSRGDQVIVSGAPIPR